VLKTRSADFLNFLEKSSLECFWYQHSVTLQEEEKFSYVIINTEGVRE